jgi:hypothetical protein
LDLDPATVAKKYSGEQSVLKPSSEALAWRAAASPDGNPQSKLVKQDRRVEQYLKLCTLLKECVLAPKLDIQNILHENGVHWHDEDEFGDLFETMKVTVTAWEFCT